VFDELTRLIERHRRSSQVGFVIKYQKGMFVRFRHFQKKLCLVRPIRAYPEVIRAPKKSAIHCFTATTRIGFIHVRQALRGLVDYANNPSSLHLDKVDRFIVMREVNDDVDGSAH